MSALGNKEIMSKNIRYYMDKANKSRKEICDALGVKYTTFTDWIKGNTYPRIDKIELMANYFGISKADLVEERRAVTSSTTQIPVYGRVAAGYPIEAIEAILEMEAIPSEMARKGEYFGLRIKGDSMEPIIHDGDNVIVRQQEDAESGEIVIAIINGNDGCCKRLKKYENGIALISINPAYEPKYFQWKEVEEKPVRIIGKVVELRRKFE